MKLYFIFLCILCMSIQWVSAAVNPEVKKNQEEKKSYEYPDVWITVFIHGTVGLKYNLDFPTFMKLLNDNVEDTHYQRVVQAIRLNSFFYEAQAMQDIGLRPIVTDDMFKGYASGLCAQLFDGMLRSQEEKSDFKNLYYTYGWSGLLSTKRRNQEASVLYHLLMKERSEVQKKYPQSAVYVRLIGFSHGGSICLNLATVRQEEAELHTQTDNLYELSVDELILMATPVQAETDYLVSDHLFKRVYHFYSRNDFVQKMDCFSFKRWFSDRRFNDSSRGTVPSKLTQIEIKIKTTVCQGCRKRRIDRSPYHSEFWYFGWVPLSYRPNFSLYPLPVVVLVPSIISLVTRALPQAGHVVVELLPDEGKAFIRKRFTYSKKCIDWIDSAKIAQMKERALVYAPSNYTYATYETHIHNALYAVHRSDTDKPRKKRLRRMRHANGIPQS